MSEPTTLTEMFDGLRGLDRSITYVEGSSGDGEPRERRDVHQHDRQANSGDRRQLFEQRQHWSRRGWHGISSFHGLQLTVCLLRRAARRFLLSHFVQPDQVG